jgi:hypothetical protein
VHIYYVTFNEALQHAANASGSWGIDTVDNELSSGNFARALDSNDNVHISYGEYEELKYTTNASGSWETRTVEIEVRARDISLALDSNDNVPFSYYEYITGL